MINCGKQCYIDIIAVCHVLLALYILRCSLLLNATQADEEVAVVTVSGSEFGRSEVESRLNISKGKFHTLECVAKTQSEHAYTLFSISGEIHSCLSK